MYIPQHFRMDDPAALLDLMERFSFATLVSAPDGVPLASHLPMLIHPAEGEHGRLIAHMARANTQWQSFTPDREVLVIFQGEHAYISPSWYEDHPSVPTWNYAVVHAYGVPRIVSDPAAVLRILRELVDRHESQFESPWPMDLPPDYERKMIKGIVAFEIDLTRLEGKFKLSQNRSTTDRRNVIAALSQQAGPYSAVAGLMSAIDENEQTAA